MKKITISERHPNGATLHIKSDDPELAKEYARQWRLEQLEAAKPEEEPIMFGGIAATQRAGERDYESRARYFTANPVVDA